MQYVKLNAFQRIMRLWDQVHPYNAMQAFRVAGDADLQRISDAWRHTLKAAGLGRVSVQRDRCRHYAPEDGDEACQPLMPEPGASLPEFLSDEMNLPIDPDDGRPLRAFVIRENGTHVLGVNYHHWIADSTSIRALLRTWYQRICSPMVDGFARANFPAGGYWHHFGPEASGWRVDDALLALLRYRTRFCRARQIARGMDDCSVSVSMHVLPDGIAPALAARAREYGVKVNDVLLATIAQAVDRHGANPTTRDRDELALGTIVDLRSMGGRDVGEAFGMFLGFTTTIVRPADLRRFPRLLRAVSLQNAFHKTSKAPQASIMRLAFGLAEASLTTPRRWAEQYRRRMPMAAGISNVNMTPQWAGQHHPGSILDYFRVSPTGPLVPLVVTPTTLGQKLNFCMTRQHHLIDAQQSQKIALSIQNRLIYLAEDGRSWDNA